jgi:ribonuclease HI
MELTAVLEGLLRLEPDSDVQIFTTSDYVFQGATRWIHGWRRRDWKKRNGKDIANKDLWQALDQLMENYAIRWVNAKGLDEPLQGLEEAGKLAQGAIDVV